MSPSFRPGRRSLLFLLLTLLTVVAWVGLDLRPADLVPRAGAGETLRLFFAGAVAPALDYEAAPPAGAPSFLGRLGDALRATLVFALAGMSLALPLGLALGFLGSRAWWPPVESPRARVARHALQVAARGVTALLRAVHELLWAVLLLAAVGLHPLAGVLALALPYGGTLGKVFAELLEEAPREPARALRALGARPIQEFLHGTLPRALPDLSSYALYRFECALRSSAVLGFFGFPTLGYYLKLSADNLHYREVWTHLYALVLVVLAFEFLSARLRERWVVR